MKTTYELSHFWAVVSGFHKKIFLENKKQFFIATGEFDKCTLSWFKQENPRTLKALQKVRKTQVEQRE